MRIDTRTSVCPNRCGTGRLNALTGRLAGAACTVRRRHPVLPCMVVDETFTLD
jgi:hypothetical protein